MRTFYLIYSLTLVALFVWLFYKIVLTYFFAKLFLFGILWFLAFSIGSVVLWFIPVVIVALINQRKHR